jgi:Pyridoxamine 5'-phosphate oxidase
VDGPTFDVLGFLDEPGRPASVATVTGRGRPALAMMWFLVEDERLWFHTPESPNAPAPFLRAARERREVAVMVATFDPPADVRQVRMTGPARLEEQDFGRVRRLYQRYVATWTPSWERQATLGSYRLWSMSPDRGMAVSYPGLEDGPTFNWSKPSELFSLRRYTTAAEQR